ncbi:uncharacterized protein [Miscanthus floridulus]|uniref:uncharacterized protein n=1 Tax=Miscanthus floridulus TaxID=154761 RepID=UPI0034595681
MSNLSSHLTTLQVPRRGVVVVAGDAVDPYDVPQPQTATCCTALQRGVASDGLGQPRYAPLRTLATVDDEEAEDGEDDSNNGKDDKDDDGATATTMRSDSNSSSGSSIRSNNKKMVRKCKSTVDELKVSQLIQGPRLRRSAGMRRDWSFENLGNAA